MQESPIDFSIPTPKEKDVINLILSAALMWIIMYIHSK